VKLALGADHAGYELKDAMASSLTQEGHEILDLGTSSPAPVDYPDFAQAVGQAVLEGRAERGIVICGSGVGASVAANKLRGIRASVCHDCYSAAQGVEHDDMNVLVLGSRVIGTALAHSLVSAFLGARFTGEERHQRRLAKVAVLESRFGSPSPESKAR
jgi:RpiB/LacA/LacB family sugar-phosphate isomerase